MSDSIQKVIQDMLNSVLPIINTPGGPYYLPTWIQTNGYDPFGKAEIILVAQYERSRRHSDRRQHLCANLPEWRSLLGAESILHSGSRNRPGT